MGLWGRVRSVVPALLLTVLFFSQNGRCQTEVSFQTEDGWKIYGTLYLPSGIGAPVPGVVLLTEPEWVDRSIYDTYLARKLARSGMAALSIDLRGTGRSLGKRSFEVFSHEERDGVRLDAKGAIDFLSSQSQVDPNRIGIVGAGVSAEYAVRGASERPSVRTVVLISSGPLGQTSRNYIQSRADVPVLFIAGKQDKKRIGEIAEAYGLSGNEDSDLILAVGHGTVMFSHTKGLEEQVIEWLDRNLRSLGSETEVSFQSADGWTLRGVLHLPDRLADGQKVPGVVLVHGAKHDQQTYYHLAHEVVKKGMAALRFDWRGKGQSVNEGKPVYGVNFPDSVVEEKGYLDVKAAIEFLAAQRGVNADRIGLVAATMGCSLALQASVGDRRVKTLVLLTALEQKSDVYQFFSTTEVPILAVASLEDNNYQRGSLAESTRRIYQLSKSKWSELLMYNDAGRGSEMFKAKPELQPMVLRWLAEKLSGDGGSPGAQEASRGAR